MALWWLVAPCLTDDPALDICHPSLKLETHQQPPSKHDCDGDGAPPRAPAPAPALKSEGFIKMLMTTKLLGNVGAPPLQLAATRMLVDGTLCTHVHAHAHAHVCHTRT